MEGVDKRAGDVLPKERAEGSGDKMEIAAEGGSGETDTGRVCATLGKDGGGDKAGGDGIATVGGPERRKVGVVGIYGVR